MPEVFAIQANPGIASRWGEPDEAELLSKAEGTDECTAFAIELEGEVVGLIQYHEEDDPMYRHAAIDLFLSPHVHGQGLGTDASSVSAAIIGSSSTRQPTTRRRSVLTRRSGSAWSA